MEAKSLLFMLKSRVEGTIFKLIGFLVITVLKVMLIVLLAAEHRDDVSPLEFIVRRMSEE